MISYIIKTITVLDTNNSIIRCGLRKHLYKRALTSNRLTLDHSFVFFTTLSRVTVLNIFFFVFRFETKQARQQPGNTRRLKTFLQVWQRWTDIVLIFQLFIHYKLEKCLFMLYIFVLIKSEILVNPSAEE